MRNYQDHHIEISLNRTTETIKYKTRDNYKYGHRDNKITNRHLKIRPKR